RGWIARRRGRWRAAPAYASRAGLPLATSARRGDSHGNALCFEQRPPRGRAHLARQKTSPPGTRARMVGCFRGHVELAAVDALGKGQQRTARTAGGVHHQWTLVDNSSLDRRVLERDDGGNRCAEVPLYFGLGVVVARVVTVEYHIDSATLDTQ